MNKSNCNDCFEEARKKVREAQSKQRYICVTGPAGPPGPPGDNLIRTAYLVTFNDGTKEDGIPVLSGDRLPINRVELDISNLITLDESEKTIKFNEIGYYKSTN